MHSLHFGNRYVPVDQDGYLHGFQVARERQPKSSVGLFARMRKGTTLDPEREPPDIYGNGAR